MRAARSVASSGAVAQCAGECRGERVAEGSGEMRAAEREAERGRRRRRPSRRRPHTRPSALWRTNERSGARFSSRCHGVVVVADGNFLAALPAPRPPSAVIHGDISDAVTTYANIGCSDEDAPVFDIATAGGPFDNGRPTLRRGTVRKRRRQSQLLHLASVDPARAFSALRMRAPLLVVPRFWRHALCVVGALVSCISIGSAGTNVRVRRYDVYSAGAS